MEPARNDEKDEEKPDDEKSNSNNSPLQSVEGGHLVKKKKSELERRRRQEILRDVVNIKMATVILVVLALCPRLLTSNNDNLEYIREISILDYLISKGTLGGIVVGLIPLACAETIGRVYKAAKYGLDE